MELRNYLAVLRRRVWVIVIVAGLTGTVVNIGTLQMTPQYVASTTLRVATVTSGPADAPRYDLTYADRLMNTYRQIATSRPIRDELAKQLSLSSRPAIEVDIIANSELMRLTAEHSSPTVAAQAANTLAEILIAQVGAQNAAVGRSAQQILGEQVAQVEGELQETRTEYERLVAASPPNAAAVEAARRSVELKERTYATLLEQYERARTAEALRANTVSVLEPAVVPKAPSSPSLALNVALGIVVGLTGGIGLAFLFEHLDTKLYTTQEIEAATALPTLATIPATHKRGHSAIYNGNSPKEEAFRRLRTNLITLNREAPQRSVLVTSAGPREGKSTVVANLAVSMAKSGQRVLIIDTDFRRPAMPRIFDLPNDVGLSNVLQQEVPLADALQESRLFGVSVLTSGPVPPNPGELLGSAQMLNLIEQLSNQFDLVLLDTPPLGSVVDAAVLAPCVDNVLLVVGLAQTRREAVQAAYQQLAKVKPRSIALVVNRAEQPADYYNHSVNHH